MQNVKKTLEITLTLTSHNTFDTDIYEPESGEFRQISCCDNGDMSEFVNEIHSWINIMREESEEPEIPLF